MGSHGFLAITTPGAQNVRHLQPFWTNLVAAQGHLQVFLLPSNFCEHLTGSLGMTLHHQPLHHTTPTALAASLPIKVHPKLMDFRPRMSCSFSFTSCHKQRRINRISERTRAMWIICLILSLSLQGLDARVCDGVAVQVQFFDFVACSL